jgi:branched-chain amino acid transport system ATP-binding protein
MSAGAELTVEDVNVAYGGVNAVAGVSLKVGAGERIAILGPNGAGKSTLLRSISGAEGLQSGRVLIDDQDVTGLPPYEILRFGLAHVLQGSPVFATMTVEENLVLGATIRAANADIKQDLANLYDRLPALARKRNVRAITLSGGQRQMLAIGRALLSKPRILLLDEPSLGLDPLVLEAVADIITSANDQLGMTVVVVEQHVSLALAISERCYVMTRGQIAFEALSAEAANGTRLEEAFLGLLPSQEG